MKATKTKRKLNVKLLRKIQKHILEEPRRFFMDWFVATGEPGSTSFRYTCFFQPRDLPAIVPPGGIVACIVAWANLFTGHRPTSRETARKELGLTHKQASNLFSFYEWPNQFRYCYYAAKTPARRVKIAADRIEHLIKAGE